MIITAIKKIKFSNYIHLNHNYILPVIKYSCLNLIGNLYVLKIFEKFKNTKKSSKKQIYLGVSVEFLRDFKFLVIFFFVLYSIILSCIYYFLSKFSVPLFGPLEIGKHGATKKGNDAAPPESALQIFGGGARSPKMADFFSINR